MLFSAQNGLRSSICWVAMVKTKVKIMITLRNTRKEKMKSKMKKDKNHFAKNQI